MSYISERIVKINVGPAGGQGRQWTDLWVDFEVEQTSGSSPNKATATLYNLSKDSIQWIERPGMVLQILAGTKSAGQVFYGDISRRNIETSWAAPDWPTKIQAADGRRVFRESQFVASFPAQTKRSDILTAIAQVMGVPIGYVDPDIADVVYPASRSFAGPCRSVLSGLCRPDGAVWSIQRGALQLLAEGRPAKRPAKLINADSGMIGSPKRTNKGVEVTTDLDPSMMPGSPFVLASELVSGNYRVTKAKHKGDTFGATWETTLTAIDY